MLDVFEQRTRPAGDDNRWFVRCELLLNRCLAGLNVIGIHDADAADTQRAAQRFQIDFCGGIALDIIPGRRIVLMPVMELSRMITVEFDALYATPARPVIPECINVESPITATELR